MQTTFERLFTRYPIKSRRALEIIPPLIALFLITMPLWGAYFFPLELSYFIIFFDVYWFYKSVHLVTMSYIAARKIRNAERIDWLVKAKQNKDFSKVNHLVVIPSYKETYEKIKETLDSIKDQTLPSEKLYIFLALEAREENVALKAEKLKKAYEKIFGGFYYTLHPDLPNEVKGKSSNQAYAAADAYKILVKKKGLDINFMTVTSCDADVLFDKSFFSYLTFSFLNVSDPLFTFWQSANVTYNNFWQVPSFTRVISFFGSLWRTSVLVQHARLVPNSVYTLSFKLLMDIGNWDTDVIPEDYRVFFKAFFKTKGRVVVEPIFLKTSMDAAQSYSYRKSLMNKYHQERRWSWGVADDATYIRWYLTVEGVPFWRKTMLVMNVLIDHILWPVNWFIITISANLVAFVNPVFTRTALGYTLPHISGFILTLCLVSILAMIYVDYTLGPKRNQEKHSKWRKLLFPVEFLFMPLAGFFLSALPALISHVQLIIGKRLEYKVTDKV
jgi:cellulose synthase/poly-beta-1,6-N-acetylglucosamine synthase-like glycosyltransferase